MNKTLRAPYGIVVEERMSKLKLLGFNLEVQSENEATLISNRNTIRIRVERYDGEPSTFHLIDGSGKAYAMHLVRDLYDDVIFYAELEKLSRYRDENSLLDISVIKKAFEMELNSLIGFVERRLNDIDISSCDFVNKYNERNQIRFRTD